MKKFVSVCVLTMLFIASFNSTVFADTATIDKSTSANGIVSISYSGTANGMAVVEKGGTKYNYVLNSATNIIPLQMGTGDYTVTALEGVGGNKYKPLVSETFSVPTIDETSLYTSSINLVNYDTSNKAIPAYDSIAGNKSSTEKVDAVYQDITANYTYDFDKASSITSNYLPDMDDMYSSKEGICYDYAVLNAGVLRSQGVPTKLVMGYAPEISEYHAWNEILVDGKWTVVDTTYDAQMIQAGQEVSLQKDPSKYKVVKVY